LLDPCSSLSLFLSQIDLTLSRPCRFTPIEGKVQLQHTTPIPEVLRTAGKSASASTSADDIDHLFLCAFSPRASNVCIAPDEEERPVDLVRRDALEEVLKRMSISSAELLSHQLAGTPPARIYRSFVCPKPNKKFILEPVERAANRTAAQLELALRQLRADDASYLRNTDKSALTLTTETRKTNPIVLVLDNIRSAFNVGSMFRTGETAGVMEIVTCGITATPPHPKLRKTALSAVDMVPCRHFEDTLSAIRDLKAQGFKIVVMETTSRSQVYTEIDFPEKVALVMGNEVMGVDTKVIDEADIIAEIPTFGIKNSLCVSSAAPIVVFEVLRQYAAKNELSGQAPVAAAAVSAVGA
jgi:tRNA G18 (ribose-2'-O)-methylase SpoU